MDDKMQLEITDDYVSLVVILEEIIEKLQGPEGRPDSRERALAVTKLQEARFWLGEDYYRKNLDSLSDKPMMTNEECDAIFGKAE